MTLPPPHHPQHGHPDDEHETPDVSTVPQGAVAVFQAPRAVQPAPRPDIDVSGSVASGTTRRPGDLVDSPFLDLVNAPRPATVEGQVVGESVPVPPVVGKELARTRQPARTGAPPKGRPAAPKAAAKKKPKPVPPAGRPPKYKDRDTAVDLAIS